MSWLNACAKASSEAIGMGVCLPVVEYSGEFQARAAEELALLPEGSAIVEMMGEYSAMREQVRACRK